MYDKEICKEHITLGDGQYYYKLTIFEQYDKDLEFVFDTLKEAEEEAKKFYNESREIIKFKVIKMYN